MSACFVDQSMVEELPLKNTFVHFDEPRRTRRATCVGFVAEKRRRSVARMQARATTAPSAKAVPVAPFDIRDGPPTRKPSGEAWRALVSASEPPYSSPCFVALRPPPVVTQPAFACMLSPCSSPPPSPYSQCPTEPWSPYPTPPSTPPITPSTPQCVWQHEAPKEAKKRGRNRKQKVPIIPAKENEMTVMLKHLPMAATPDAIQAQFTQFLPFIDFYYLPTNFETKKNLGYAFVNFTDRDVAREFAEYWEQTGIAETEEQAVVDARVQGYAENVERFRNSSVMPVLAEELKPRIFCKGVQMAFPQGDGAAPAVGSRFRPTGQ